MQQRGGSCLPWQPLSEMKSKTQQAATARSKGTECNSRAGRQGSGWLGLKSWLWLHLFRMHWIWTGKWDIRFIQMQLYLCFVYPKGVLLHASRWHCAVIVPLTHFPGLQRALIETSFFARRFGKTHWNWVQGEGSAFLCALWSPQLQFPISFSGECGHKESVWSNHVWRTHCKYTCL